MTRRIRLVRSAQGASRSPSFPPPSLSLSFSLLVKGCNFFSSILDRTMGPNDRPIRQRLINGNDLRVPSLVRIVRIAFELFRLFSDASMQRGPLFVDSWTRIA